MSTLDKLPILASDPPPARSRLENARALVSNNQSIIELSVFLSALSVTSAAAWAIIFMDFIIWNAAFSYITLFALGAAVFAGAYTGMDGWIYHALSPIRVLWGFFLRVSTIPLAYYLRSDTSLQAVNRKTGLLWKTQLERIESVGDIELVAQVIWTYHQRVNEKRSIQSLPAGPEKAEALAVLDRDIVVLERDLQSLQRLGKLENKYNAERCDAALALVLAREQINQMEVGL